MTLELPIGAVVTATSYNVPGYYGAGPAFPTFGEALAHAVDELKGAIAKHDEWYAAEKAAHSSLYVPLPETITIDYRVTFAFPKTNGGNGGGLDTGLERTTFTSLVDAERVLATQRRYGKVPA